MKFQISKSKVAKNATMMMLFNVIKLVFPFITFPYLARVLSTECYGTVSYVKAVMGYMQTIVDFGFLLSATKHVVEVKEDKEKIGYIVGDNILAKLLIATMGAVGLVGVSLFLPIVEENLLFTFLSYLTVVLSIFLCDFLFRGIEKMEIITYRFLAMKTISTVLTFVVIKDDSDILWIPLLDIIGSLVAVVLVFVQIKKENINIRFSGIKKSWQYIKESSIYFISNMAAVSFSVFNTIVMGIFLTKTEIAYWSVSIQIISAIQALLNPISDAVYPEMIKTKSKATLHKILKIFIPVVGAGCIVALCCAPLGMYIVGGDNYLPATNVFRVLVPVIFFGFLAIIFGWPTLGAIGKVKETTRTTVSSVLFQITAIILVAVTGKISLYNVAVIRSLTEIVLFVLRYRYYRIFRTEFNDSV